MRMSDGQPSKLARATTWLVLALTIVLIVLGVSWYGLSMHVQERFWHDLFDRVHGPMTFRFYLQPTMAAIAALPDAIRDARLGHTSFYWTAQRDPRKAAGRLREGLIATARVVLLGISMDVIYQYRVLHRFYPVEALVMAILLAVIPYFILRWVFEWIARWWFARGHSRSSA